MEGCCWREKERGEGEESSCGSLWLQTSVISMPSSWCLNPQRGPRQSTHTLYTHTLYTHMCTWTRARRCTHRANSWHMSPVASTAQINARRLSVTLYLCSLTLSHYAMDMYNSLASEFSDFPIRLLGLEKKTDNFLVGLDLHCFFHGQ